jgi:hypothetical protein
LSIALPERAIAFNQHHRPRERLFVKELSRAIARAIPLLCNFTDGSFNGAEISSASFAILEKNQNGFAS